MTSKIPKWIFLSFYIVFLFSCSDNEHIQDNIHSDNENTKGNIHSENENIQYNIYSNYEHIQENFYRDSRSGKIYYKSKEEDAITYNEVQYNID